MSIPRNDMRQAMQAYREAPPETVKENEVKFIHIRNITVADEVAGKGGTTVAYVDCGGGVYRFAIAKCHNSDNYNKKVGRAKAGGKLASPKHSYMIDKIASIGDLIDYVVSYRRGLN